MKAQEAYRKMAEEGVMKVMWCVCSGPNESHLIDVRWFARLKDAKAFAETLPITPSGKPRPYKIERHEFKGDYS